MVNKATLQMLKFHSSGIAVEKRNAKNFLRSIETKVRKKIIDKFNMTSFFDTSLYNIVAYPDSDVNELYTIMTQLGISKIPVATNPWNRKLIGFIDIDTLEKVLEKA